MITLSSPITVLWALPRTMITTLSNMGIRTIGDALTYFPKKHEDVRNVLPIADIRPGKHVAVCATVEHIKSFRSPKRHLVITQAVVRDDTGSMRVVWFHQPYLVRTIPQGSQVYLVGSVRADTTGHEMMSPMYEKISTTREAVHAGRIIPLYPLSGKVTQKILRTLIHRALPSAALMEDPIPKAMRTDRGYIDRIQAVQWFHFPDTEQQLARARERLAFEELFLLQCELMIMCEQWKHQQAKAYTFHQEPFKAFVDRLPFTLTNEQKRVSWDIVQDMGNNHPMNRLLQGDVGSGKTVIAALALEHCVEAGGQGVLMAPTELLAHQHYETLKQFFTGSGRVLALLSHTYHEDSRGPVTKSMLIKRIRAGDIDIVVGTHALIAQSVTFHELGLIVIDEQHRFGVNERKLLKEKGHDAVPHILALTATPIPRTLAIMLMGGVQLSTLKGFPGGGKKIVTRIYPDSQRAQAFDIIDEEIKHGNAAFIVCPVIDPTDRFGTLSIQEMEDVVKQTLPHRRYAIVHGGIDAARRDQRLAQLANGDIDILIATTVIEVGIDVGRATVMMIEAAERFGLAQLHQLRGRIGRRGQASHCIVIQGTVDPVSTQRLHFFTQHLDGFALAQKDLTLRGPGQWYGFEQHGLPELSVASWDDTLLIQEVHAKAKELFTRDPALANTPELKKIILERMQQARS